LELNFSGTGYFFNTFIWLSIFLSRTEVNKVKVLKRRSYGLSSATKLFQRLILGTLGLEMFGARTTAI